jgi:hypothetical protein
MTAEWERQTDIRATEEFLKLVREPPLASAYVFHCGSRVIVMSSLRCQHTIVRGLGQKRFRRGLSWRCFFGSRAEFLDCGPRWLLP